MPVTNKDQRIQALRGLAAMLIVVLHARATLDALGLPLFALARFVPANGFGAFGVDLFFVISGAVIGMALERDNAPRSFLRARFLRVVPLFWLTATVTIALSIALGRTMTIQGLANSITILPLFDSGVVHPPIPSVGWTLAFELFFYAIVAAAFALPMRRRFDAVLAALMLGALIGMTMRPVLVPILGIACNAMLLEFALGLLVLRAARHPLAARYAPLLVVLGAGVLLYSAAIGFGIPSAPQAVVAGQTSAARVLAWGLPSALLLAGLLAHPDRMRANGPLPRLGNASYALYLVHAPVMMVLPLIWPRAGSNDLLLLTLVLVATLAGLAAHRWVEKPLLARLQRRRPTFQTAAARFAA